MGSLDGRLAQLKKIKWLVSTIRVAVAVTPFGLTAFTYVTALAAQMPIATVVTLTVLTLAGAVLLVNQIAILFGMPTLVAGTHDYSYGLWLSNLHVGFEEDNETEYLQIGVQLANSTPSPIRYRVERFDIVIGDRTIVGRSYANDGGIIAAVGTTIYRHHAYPKQSVAGYLGTKQAGVVEVHIVYGHPDHPAVRRMKRKLQTTLKLTPPNIALVYLNLEESDEAI